MTSSSSKERNIVQTREFDLDDFTHWLVIVTSLVSVTEL